MRVLVPGRTKDPGSFLILVSAVSTFFPTRDRLPSSHSLPPSPKRSPRQPPKDIRLFSTNFAPSWWWSQRENKESVDRLLDEGDRAETVEREQENIHNKCQLVILTSRHLTQRDYTPPLNRSCSEESRRVLPWSDGLCWGASRSWRALAVQW